MRSTCRSADWPTSRPASRCASPAPCCIAIERSGPALDQQSGSAQGNVLVISPYLVQIMEPSTLRDSASTRPHSRSSRSSRACTSAAASTTADLPGRSCWSNRRSRSSARCGWMRCPTESGAERLLSRMAPDAPRTLWERSPRSDGRGFSPGYSHRTDPIKCQASPSFPAERQHPSSNAARMCGSVARLSASCAIIASTTRGYTAARRRICWAYVAPDHHQPCRRRHLVGQRTDDAHAVVAARNSTTPSCSNGSTAAAVVRAGCIVSGRNINPASEPPGLPAPASTLAAAESPAAAR